MKKSHTHPRGTQIQLKFYEVMRSQLDVSHRNDGVKGKQIFMIQSDLAQNN